MWEGKKARQIGWDGKSVETIIKSRYHTPEYAHRHEHVTRIVPKNTTIKAKLRFGPGNQKILKF